MKTIEQLIEDRAFYYIAPDGDLCLSDSGETLIPSIAITRAKAFWIKNSPARVWVFADIYKTEESFVAAMDEAIARGANAFSVHKILEQAGLAVVPVEVNEREQDVE